MSQSRGASSSRRGRGAARGRGHARRSETATPATTEAKTDKNGLPESFFDDGLQLLAIDTIQTISHNFSQLINLAEEVFDQYKPDVKFLDKILNKDEFIYFSVALLWFKLIDIKLRQATVCLTTQEKSIHTAMKDKEFAIPEPIFIYLSQIGPVQDSNGKMIYIEVPALPIAAIGGKGAYHSAAVSETTHILWEEVPTLGIIRDMIMSLAAPANAAPIVPLGKPNHTEFNTNLLGFRTTALTHESEITQRLAGLGITTTEFPEHTRHTGVNIDYLDQLNTIIAKFPTFEVKKIKITDMPNAGTSVQYIQTHSSTTEELDENWRKVIVVAKSPAHDTPQRFGAAITFGFQLYKTSGTAPNAATAAVRWNCLTPVREWVIPNIWVANRNARRALPETVTNVVFQTQEISQSVNLENIVRRLIKTAR